MSRRASERQYVIAPIGRPTASTILARTADLGAAAPTTLAQGEAASGAVDAR